MVIDTLELAKMLAKGKKRITIGVKDTLCPIILGCYDKGMSEACMTILKTNCYKAGYTNTLLLKDISDHDKNSPIPNNEKFKILIDEWQGKNKIVCPVFYINQAINKGHGKGVICEFLDIVYNYTDLRQFTIVIKHPEADFIEQLDFIHNKNIYIEKDIKKSAKKLIEHLRGHEGYAKRQFFSSSTKNLNSLKLIKSGGR